jgi:hypothetical protein
MEATPVTLQDFGAALAGVNQRAYLSLPIRTATLPQ